MDYTENFTQYYCVENLKYILYDKGVIGNTKLDEYLKMFLDNVVQKYMLENNGKNDKFGHDDIQKITKEIKSHIDYYENQYIKLGLNEIFNKNNLVLTSFQKENIQINKIHKNISSSSISQENIKELVSDIKNLLDKYVEEMDNEVDQKNTWYKSKISNILYDLHHSTKEYHNFIQELFDDNTTNPETIIQNFDNSSINDTTKFRQYLNIIKSNLNDIIVKYINKSKELIHKIQKKDINMDDELINILFYPTYYENNVLIFFSDIVEEINKINKLTKEDRNLIYNNIEEFKKILKDMDNERGKYNDLISQH